MSYGFLAINESGFTQIDGTYDNLSVLASGTGTTSYASSQPSGHVLNLISLPSGSPSDVAIFAKPSSESGAYVFFLYVVSGGFYIMTPMNSNSTVSVDYKICVRSRDMPSSPNVGYGLKVYKNNGEEAYSSNNENFKCLFVASDNTSAGSQASYSPVSISSCFRLMNGSNIVAYFPTGSSQGQIILVAYAQKFDYTNNEIVATTTFARILGGQGALSSNQIKTNLVGKFA